MECLRDHLFLSASDLVNFLECEHLTHLDLEVATGRLALERTRTDSTELIAAKGAEHSRSASSAFGAYSCRAAQPAATSSWSSGSRTSSGE